MEVNHRFKGFPWYKYLDSLYPRQTVTVAGLGGVGSWLTLFLSRIGNIGLRLYDFDKVEQHNIGCQFLANDSLYMYKTTAMVNVISKFSNSLNLNYSTYTEKVTEYSILSPISFCCFDNLESRNVMVDNWYNSYKDDPKAIFIDGRLEGELFIIYCVRPNEDSYNKYKETLDKESLVDTVGACTTEQSTHMGAAIASMMTILFTNHLSNLQSGTEVREVPFKTDMLCPLLDLNFE